MKALHLLALLLPALCVPAAAQTWELQTSGSTSTIYAVDFISPDTGWIGGEGSFIRKTTNGGLTWVTQSGQRNITDFHFLGKDTGFAVAGSSGAGLILRTVNGGSTWTSVTSSGIAVLWHVSFQNRLLGWATGAGGTILRTTNGGTAWIAQTSGASTDFRGHHFINADTGWVVGLSGVIRKTTNGGANWTAQTSGTSANLGKVQFLDANNGYAVGDAGSLVLKTTNGGTTWVSQGPGGTGAIYALTFQDVNNGYIVGSAGRVFKTTNGGTAWTAVATPTSAEIVNIQFVSPGKAWCVGTQGTLLKPSVPPGPSNLSYAANPARYTTGVAIPQNTPSVSSGTGATYSVSPGLPEGLSLDPSTGRITGTPTTNSAPSNHVVTATTAYGSTTATLNIGVGPAPTALSYGVNPAAYPLGQAISPNTPFVIGSVTAWSVSPALPAGLAFNISTGAISGTPSAASPAANYTVTASNSSGSSTTTVLRLVTQVKPSGLSYAANPVTYTVGTAINSNTATLTGTGPFTYYFSSLPNGLMMNSSTGAIFGTPGAPSAQTSYTITVSNEVGSATVNLWITVVAPGSALAGSGASGSFGFAAPGARLTFKAPPQAARTVRAEVLSSSGARVWERTAPMGRELSWNGTARDGKPAAAGVYLVRLTWRGAADEVLGSESRLLPRASAR